MSQGRKRSPAGVPAPATRRHPLGKGQAITTDEVVKQRRTPGRAVAAMVLGIVGVTIVPLIASIIAVVLGRGARAEIDAHPESLEGRSMATAGIVLGWIGIALVPVAFVIGFAIGS
ncbi:MAG: hypothetical protein QOD86_796 [Miltoncostaeaceae bacterium]|jgi:hypothetical protein|nr:hypothetical protein [Miltoncostaeaceae bacterium]